jgi:hypothetical protein
LEKCLKIKNEFELKKSANDFPKMSNLTKSNFKIFFRIRLKLKNQRMIKLSRAFLYLYAGIKNLGFITAFSKNHIQNSTIYIINKLKGNFLGQFNFIIEWYFKKVLSPAGPARGSDVLNFNWQFNFTIE